MPAPVSNSQRPSRLTSGMGKGQWFSPTSDGVARTLLLQPGESFKVRGEMLQMFRVLDAVAGEQLPAIGPEERRHAFRTSRLCRLDQRLQRVFRRGKTGLGGGLGLRSGRGAK